MNLRERAAALKANSYALYLATRDARTPPLARWLTLAIIAYLLSPIDLIPDFIPVIGYLDDLILLPLAIAVVIRMIPDEVWHECQAQATEQLAIDSPHARSAAAIIIVIWALLVGWIGLALWRWLNG